MSRVVSEALKATKKKKLVKCSTNYQSNPNFSFLQVEPLTKVVRETLLSAKVLDTNIYVLKVPGCYELPITAQMLAKSGKVDVIICIGLLIKGETMHFEYISLAVSQGIMQVQLSTGVPVLYGVLNCMNLEQATARCVTDQTLGTSLALSALRMGGLKRNFESTHNEELSHAHIVS